MGIPLNYEDALDELMKVKEEAAEAKAQSSWVRGQLTAYESIIEEKDRRIDDLRKIISLLCGRDVFNEGN